MRHVETVMGFPVSLDVRDVGDVVGDGLARLVRGAFGLLHDADARFSPFRPDSEASRFGRGEVASAAVSADLREVLALAESAAVASGGAFSTTAPDGSFDANGVVKGWAVQRAADLLVAGGLRAFCLNAGGDVVTRGSAAPGRPWRVGVRHPEDPTRMLAVVEQHDGAVATSGTYERGAHVWDGRTGRPAVGLVAATVVGDLLTTADVLATCVLALGPDGVGWAVAQGARSALGVRPDGTLVEAGERLAA